MKLEKLRIHNIASIEDAEIDFSAAPLADCEVFLITGRTGSGKSTILDAICLALYNEAPRMKNSAMEGTLHDSAGDSNVNVSDCRNLLRRGSGEGYVKLEFSGNDGCAYAAEWSVKRAYRRPGGALQKVQRCLTDTTSGESWEKEREIKERFFQAVGLDFEQFCRTCMLAQGEFSRFLNSKDDNKSAILEKITGTGTYTRIGAKIFELCKKHGTELDNIRLRIGDVRCLTDIERDRRNEERNILLLELRTLIGTLAVLENKREWLRQYTRLQAQIALQKSESDIASDYSCILGGIKTLERELEHYDREGESIRKKLAAFEPKKTVIDNAGVIIERINRESVLIHECSELARKMENAQSELALLVDRQTEKNEAVEKARLRFDSTDKLCRQKETELAAMKLPELFESRAAVKGSIDAALRTAEEIRKLLEAERALASEYEDLKKKADDIRAAESLVAALGATVKADAESEAILKAAYDTVRAQGEKWVSDCRHRLRPGDCCPVCLGKITQALPTDEYVYRNNILPVEDAWKKMHEKLEGGRRRHSEAEARLKAEREVYVKSQTRLDVVAADLSGSRKCMLEKLNEYGGGGIENADDIILRFQSRKREELAGIDDLISKARILAEETERIRLQYRSDNAELKAVEKLLSDSTREADRIRNVLAGHQKMVESKNAEIAAIRIQLAADLTESIWGDAMAMPRQDLISLLTGLTTDYKATTAEMERNTSLSAQCRHRLESVALGQKMILDLRPRLRDVEAGESPAVPADVETGIRTLIAELAQSDSWQAELRKQLEKRPEFSDDENSETIEESITGIDRRKEELNRRLGAIDDELRQDDERRKQLGDLLQQEKMLASGYDSWKKLSDMFGSRDGKKFRCIAQSYVLGHLVEIANGYMEHLMPRYSLAVQPGTFIILVEDRYQGGARRPASSISGGETFVVSLALALALSDMSGSIDMDMLFIDEGFGTLSGDALQRAVNTLRGLHGSGKRRVGIISHVEELRACIDVRIEVKQQGRNGASRIEITA